MNLTKLSSEVYRAKGPISKFGPQEIEFLKAEVQRSARGRIRINMHQDSSESLHEMFISLLPDSYVRPHKHLNKVESFHIISGLVDVVVFDDEGNIIDVIELGMGDQKRSIFYRMSSSFYHTLIIRSDILIVHEITNGPFEEGKADYAHFSPSEKNKDEVDMFMSKLVIKVDKFLGSL